LLGSDEDDDGEPDYETPVTYWMPFVDNSIGFHDAYWRSSFGGTIYTYGGSHGCINLPTSAAQSLYDIIEVGTVVVVHW
jgi:lipoprotein-anchoring transpeptidase ErfK/SrfK